MGTLPDSERSGSRFGPFTASVANERIEVHRIGNLFQRNADGDQDLVALTDLAALPGGATVVAEPEARS